MSTHNESDDRARDSRRYEPSYGASSSESGREKPRQEEISILDDDMTAVQPSKSTRVNVGDDAFSMNKKAPTAKSPRVNSGFDDIDIPSIKDPGTTEPEDLIEPEAVVDSLIQHRPAVNQAVADIKPVPASQSPAIPAVAAEAEAAEPEEPVEREQADDSLLGCLMQVAEFYETPLTEEAFISGLPVKGRAMTPEHFVRAAERAHLEAQIVVEDIHDFDNNVLPVVLMLKNGEAWLLVNITADKQATIRSGTTEREEHVLPLENLVDIYSGQAILVKPVVKFERKKSLDDKKQHWFWKVMIPTWPIYGEVAVSAILINLLMLASPLFVMNVYDRVVPNNATDTLWVLAIGVAIAFMFDFALRMLRTYFVDHTAKRVDAKLSASIFEQLMGIKMDARPKSVGNMTNIVQGFESFRDFITSTSITILIDFPFVLLFIAFIAFIGGTLAIVPLVAIPIVLTVALVIQRPFIKLVQKSYALAAERQSTVIETLFGIQSVKTLNAQSKMQRRWEEAVCYGAKIGAKMRMLSALTVNFSIFMQYMATVSIVVLGVYKIAAGDITVGALIASTILTGRAMGPMVQIATLLMRYYQSTTGIEAVNGMMNLPVERPAGFAFLNRAKIQGKVEFNKVNFSYPESQILALNQVSFSINPGEKVAIIGRIGSGKTTAQKLMVGLYQAQAGNVFIDGVDIQQLDPLDLRKHVGYVPQDVVLFSGTIKDNLLLGDRKVSDEHIIQAAKIAGLDRVIASNPDGFNLAVGERGDTLSGGQRQTVAITQALLHDPTVVVMDEPTAAMDEISELQFKDRLGKFLTEEKTFVLVTHKGSMLSLVDRIILMDDGHVVADGPKEKVIQALKERKLQPQTR